MIDRVESGFHPFVLPFLFGMIFVLSYCLIGMVRVIWQLPVKDRRRFGLSLINPTTLVKNIKDIFLNCLIHVKLWKRNKMLGYMHSSIAFGWFMLILLGHIEVILFVPGRLHTFYYPIFFNYFVAEDEATIQGALLMTLMDIFLLLTLSGIVLAMIKRIRSRFFGMRRTTRPSFLDRIGLYSLWAIFPLRLLAEGFTAHISGGGFLIIPLNWVLRQFLGDQMNMLPTWWAYSIALCIFMCVLPFTRYMHIPSEMLLIPLRNAGITIKHPRKGFAKAMVYSCPGCGVCIDACPMTVRKENIKDATVYLNRQIRRNNERRIEQISDKCLLCGKCKEVCQVMLDGPAIRVAQRANRKYTISQDYKEIEPALMPEQHKVLYFAGCMTHLTPSIRKSMTALLDIAGEDWQFMDKDGGICCGRPLLMAGRNEQAQALIEKNIKTIESSGCSILLLSCPICYKVFNESYHLQGVKVMHHTQYFAELIREGKLKVESSDWKIAYHDPCELGRGSGIYDEPRELISSLGELVEAKENRQMSICCGGSLGSLSLSFAQREEITRNAFRNLVYADPDEVATACPLCRSTFQRYADRPVRDIAEILEDSVVTADS